jgi:GTP cyclohydrolase II
VRGALKLKHLHFTDNPLPYDSGKHTLNWVVKLSREGISMLTREEICNDCVQGGSKEDLEAKMTGKPDFVEGDHYCSGTGKYCLDDGLCVQLVAHARLPTRFGNFELYGFYDAKADKEHTAVVKGDIAGKENVPVRIHSECHTGDVLGSLRCDCRDQLEFALRYVEKQPFGAVIYLKQEGRGIGLLNKIKAYQLQELGLDTVEANLYLGFPDEARDYGVAAKILTLLEVKSVSLLTNNPDKIEKLQSEGVKVMHRIPIVIQPNNHDEEYLKVKRDRMGHLL